MAFERYLATVETAEGKKVSSIEVRLVVEDMQGTFWFTDLTFQEGRWATGHVPATQEILKRERDAGGNPIQYRHFNVVVRGAKIIAVPNRASVYEETDITKRVTGGMDFTFWPTQSLPSGALRFSHQYRTRTFRLNEPLAAGDEFRFWASRRKVQINSRDTRNYSGFYHTIPAGFGRFNVEMIDPSTETTDPITGTTTAKPIGSGYLLCEVDTWLKGIGGERM